MVDKLGHLSADEIVELHNRGHEIAIHCARHQAPGQIRAIEGIQEVMQNRIDLEKISDGIIRGMAYLNSGVRKLQSGVS